MDRYKHQSYLLKSSCAPELVSMKPILGSEMNTGQTGLTPHSTVNWSHIGCQSKSTEDQRNRKPTQGVLNENSSIDPDGYTTVRILGSSDMVNPPAIETPSPNRPTDNLYMTDPAVITSSSHNRDHAMEGEEIGNNGMTVSVEDSVVQDLDSLYTKVEKGRRPEHDKGGTETDV